MTVLSALQSLFGCNDHASIDAVMWLSLQMSHSSDHSIVVYTPALLDPEAGIRTFNITLPEGTFCSDVMIDPSKHKNLWRTCVPCNAYVQALLAVCY